MLDNAKRAAASFRVVINGVDVFRPQSPSECAEIVHFLCTKSTMDAFTVTRAAFASSPARVPPPVPARAPARAPASRKRKAKEPVVTRDPAQDLWDRVGVSVPEDDVAAEQEDPDE